MASADDAGDYDCARFVGVVAGAGQVGAVGLVGPEERCGAQELPSGWGRRCWTIAQVLVWSPIVQPLSDVESCACGSATRMRRALNSCDAEDDQLTSSGFGWYASDRYEVGGGEFAWGDSRPVCSCRPRRSPMAPYSYRRASPLACVDWHATLDMDSVAGGTAVPAVQEVS